MSSDAPGILLEPITQCGTCLQTDDHPKHQIAIGVAEGTTGPDGKPTKLYHEHDLGQCCCIYYHFDCQSIWHDLRSVLAVDPRGPVRAAETGELVANTEWLASSAAEHLTVALRHEATIAKAKGGVHGNELRSWIFESAVIRGPDSGLQMMAAVDSVQGTAYLAAISINSSTSTVGTKTYTGPFHLRLMTANGTATANGTELGTSGGYTAGGQAISFGTAASLTVASNSANTWTSMPSCTLTGIEEWDTSGTPLRLLFAAFSGGNIVVGAGNTFTVASGNLTNNMS